MTYFSAGQMLAIECNPRLHSNITLMDTRRQQAAEAIYQAPFFKCLDLGKNLR